MIRIDENTYIDDTLVTCAEYQLFIDEMREQGKYFQPDHWTSYKFPEGQARSPVVGVRFKDAETFCKWLTERETKEWLFRLPTSDDANLFPLINPIQVLLGYWTIGVENAEFVWIGSILGNPRYIDINNSFEQSLNRDIDHTISRIQKKQILDLARDIIQNTYDSSHIPNRISIFSPRRNKNIGGEFNSDLDFAQNQAVTLIRSLVLDRVFALAKDNVFIYPDTAVLPNRDLDRGSNNTEKLNYFQGSDLYHTVKLVIEDNRARALDDDLVRIRIIIIEFAINEAILLAQAQLHFNDHNRRYRDQAINFGEEINRRLNTHLSQVLFNLTLQERIAGRSPAFEGIRLAKERKP
jgi:hypothetical protein